MDSKLPVTHGLLIVDDTPGNLKLLAGILTSAGYAVRPTDSGDLALRSAQAQPPALILLDIKLPGMDGYEVCRRLKADPRTRPIPVIFISALNNESEMVRGFQAGGVDYITKPYRAEEVLARVNTHLTLRRIQLELESRNQAFQAEIQARQHAETTIVAQNAELQAQREELQAQNEQLLAQNQELQAQEGELREKQQLLQAIVDYAPALVYVFDHAGRCRLANRQLAGLFNTTSEAMLGTSREAWLPEAIAQTHRRNDLHILEAQQPVAFEEVNDEPDGQHTYLTVKFPLLNAAGRVAEVGGISTDITQRKQAEAALQREQEFTHTLLDNLADGVVACDAQGQLALFNRISREWHGLDAMVLPPEQWVEHYQLFGPDGQTPLATEAVPLVRAFQGEPVRDAAMTIVARGQAPRHVLASGGPIVDTAGRKLGAVIVLRDITERKHAEQLIQAQQEQLEAQNEELLAQNEELTAQGQELARTEAELRRLNTNLEQHVAARTVELAARSLELTEANVALKRSARLKDEFLATMSHELRTPLTAILGLSETLQMGIYGSLTEKQLKALRTIRDSGQHLLDLITDILDLSKLEAGRLDLQLGPVIVSDVCQASLAFIKQQAHKKDLRVQVELDNRVNLVLADARRLKQMLVNLLGNAVKFTPAGGDVGLKVESDAARHAVHFVVWDTGIGIAPQNQSRLFQPFTQIDSRLAREYEGTGLGLSLVQRMADLHHGRVAVESDGVPGKGSRFTLSLPWQPADNENEPAGYRQVEIEARPVFAPAAELAATKIASRQNVLLLVDDNADALFALSVLLEAHGYTVQTASNGADAIAQTQALRPDAILLDIQMPGVDGFDVLRRLRADPALAAMPIIALTALAMPGDRERCLEAGATDYLSKPVDFPRLLQRIPQLLERRAESCEP